MALDWSDVLQTRHPIGARKRDTSKNEPLDKKINQSNKENKQTIKKEEAYEIFYHTK